MHRIRFLLWRGLPDFLSNTVKISQLFFWPFVSKKGLKGLISAIETTPPIRPKAGKKKKVKPQNTRRSSVFFFFHVFCFFGVVVFNWVLIPFRFFFEANAKNNGLLLFPGIKRNPGSSRHNRKRIRCIG